MRTHTVTFYTKEDCEALDNMSREEVIKTLENLEGGWMPGRPSAYYQLTTGRTDEAELDYDLLRACKAVDLAIKWLKEGKSVD